MSAIHKSLRFDSRRSTLLAVAVGLVASGCSQAPAPSVQAEKDVSKSFSSLSKVEVANRLNAGVGVTRLGDLAYLEIQKDALDKEFLLSASLIAQRGAPTGNALKGRVVAFAKHGRSIFLMEATDGHLITDSLPSSLILAEMPVILETEKSYVIDFNAGMKKIFVMGSWGASDTEENSSFNPEKQTEIGRVGSSFINRIEIVDDKNIEIRQIVQLDEASSANSYEVRYFLSPYITNENFKPTETSDFRAVGFFETPAVLEKNTGRTIINTTRFDISKPIKFSLSANTPEDYRQAIKEGILYWNKVLGRDLIQVDIAPEGVTAPDARFNVVQWIEWDQAGFAYAAALNDPRTGETINAHVFLTSFFGWGGKLQARRLIRRNDESSVDSRQAAFAQKLGIKGLSSSNLCLNDSSSRIEHVAKLALRFNASEETLLALAQDYVREVVAHEIGHTLGLRHNFAGNYAANASPEIIDERMAALIKDPETSLQDIIPTSSVMEYQSFAEGLITGRQIARGEAAYSYDNMAIRHAYFGETIDTRTSPLFCTDSSADESLPNFKSDCLRNDRGRSMMEGGFSLVRREMKDLANAFVETHLAALAPVVGRRRIELENVNMEPTVKATLISTALRSALLSLNPESQSLQVVKKYPFLNSLSKGELLKDQYAFVREEAARQGGFKTMIFDILANDERGLLRPDWVQLQVNNVRGVLAKKSVTNFEGPDGQKMQLSEEQKALILGKAQSYFVGLQQQLVQKVLAVYSEGTWNLELLALGDLEEEGLTVSLETGLAETMPRIVLTRSDRQVVIPVAPDNKVLFQAFLFQSGVRAEAAALLGSSLVDLKNWSKAAREKTKSDYESIMKTALSMQSLDEIDASIEAGNRSLQLWWKSESPVWANLQ